MSLLRSDSPDLATREAEPPRKVGYVATVELRSDLLVSLRFKPSITHDVLACGDLEEQDGQAPEFCLRDPWQMQSHLGFQFFGSDRVDHQYPLWLPRVGQEALFRR